MAQSKAATVKEYLAELPADRREIINSIRKVILQYLPKGYTETMQYGMISYGVPLKLYPAGYHCGVNVPLPYTMLASQKNYCSIYLMCVYGDPETEGWFRKGFAAAGKKLDMGKACVRFKRVEDLALPMIGKAIARCSVKEYIRRYEGVLRNRK